MASERLVTQAKSALLRHYQTRPARPATRRRRRASSDGKKLASCAYDEERECEEACVWWAHEFVQLLADYDFMVGGSTLRDADVRAWVGQVEGEGEGEGETRGGVGSGRGPRNRGGKGTQDPVPSSEPVALLSLARAKLEDSEISVEDEIWEDMNRYMAVPNWDYLVDRIHRVERSEVTGEIMVYFTSRHGEKIKETGRLCKARLPKKLLAFYEENLRWDNNVVNGHY
ncbi:hypothetical protein APHAL10511_005287 [Amanita phalloides]|nr:hypothetical protein APHAL10511_005287 [Amanita phalloides]